MQERHKNYDQYFRENDESCSKYYLPFFTEYATCGQDKLFRVLEVGCGVGGNLAPYARRGCEVKGVDIDSNSIEWAIKMFTQEGLSGTFVHTDIHEYEDVSRYDLIILHDVIEHISDKERLMSRLRQLLSDDATLHIAFPAWCMPFGGHQQVARTKFVSRCPFIHLLPSRLFVWLLRRLGENESVISDFLNIRDTRMTIQDFEKLCMDMDMKVVHRRFYFINPHYETKFGLKPRILWKWISCLPYIRDFFSTSCHYLLTKK